MCFGCVGCQHLSSRTAPSGATRVCSWRLEGEQALVGAPIAAGQACDPIWAADEGIEDPLVVGGGCTPVGDAALGLGFRLRPGRLLPCVVYGQSQRIQGKKVQLGRGWGGVGAGSLTPNSLLGDSSSQSFDTSHGNHGPEMSDSLWRSGSHATAGARVLSLLGSPPAHCRRVTPPLGSRSLWKPLSGSASRRRRPVGV